MNKTDLAEQFAKAIAEDRARRKKKPVNVVKADRDAGYACMQRLEEIKKQEDYVMKNASRGFPK